MEFGTQQNTKRDQLLAAALIVLARYGFHGFSMKQLAAEAKVAAGTTYLYFEDKEHLIEQLHEEILRHISVEFFVGHDASLPAKGQFINFCRNYWRFCMREKEAVLSKAQFDHLPPDVLIKQRRDARKLFQPLVQFFEQCREQRVIKDLPDEVLISFSIEALAELAAKVHRGIVEIDEAMFDQVLSACWDAIALNPSTSKSTTATARNSRRAVS